MVKGLLHFIGIANTTASEYVTSPQVDVDMSSSGSTLAQQAIYILAFIMFVILKGKHSFQTFESLRCFQYACS